MDKKVIPKSFKTFIDIVNKIFEWMCFTVLFAFIPLIAIFIVSQFWGYTGGEYKYVSEILFICIIVSAESLRTLLVKRSAKLDFIGFRNLFLIVSLLTIIFPSFLYGGMLLEHKSLIEDVMTIPRFFLIASLANGISVKIWEAV